MTCTLTDSVTDTAWDLVGARKGILAADESIATMSMRLEKAGVTATEHSRLAYREMLVTTPGLSDGVSGVILCDETFRQCLADGRTFPQALSDMGIFAGIKVDAGAQPLPGAPGEKVTAGLDGLDARLAEYAELGARFAKWRAVITIGEAQPSLWTLRANAHALARYARACQEAGIVPIVEPEVLMDGAHSLWQCAATTALTLATVTRALTDAGVEPAGMVLKPNMVLPGSGAMHESTPEEVARVTVQTLRATVADDVAGIAFLSGGQLPQTATANLAAMSRIDTPWPVTFSFGRALVSPPLMTWRGDPARAAAAQAVLSKLVTDNASVLIQRKPSPEIL